MGYRYLCEFERLQPVLDESGALPRYVDPIWDGYLARLTPALFREKYEERLPAQVSGAEFNERYPTHLDPFTPVRPGGHLPGACGYSLCSGRELAGEPVLRADLRQFR